jgi:CRP-like cAMP-binding protein
MSDAAPQPGPGLVSLLQLAGDEALLPAGSRLCDQRRVSRQCFLIIEGTATVERDGARLGSLSGGAFVGDLDPAGRPLPPSGITVRLDTRCRVLVIDPARLSALLDAEPSWAGALRELIPGWRSPL